MPLPRLVIMLGFALATLPAACAAAAETAPVETPTFAPVQGELPNGLHYFVLPHASSKNDLSLRLIVHAGSLDEHDDELGYAHFIEHMPFNGTPHYPRARRGAPLRQSRDAHRR